MTNEQKQRDIFQPWNDACEHWLLNQATNLEQFFSDDQEKQDNRNEEMRIADVALNGFISTVAIFGAIEIGLFEVLASSPCSLKKVVQQLNAEKNNLNHLLLTLQRVGLVKLKSQEWVLEAAARRFFTPSAPEFEPYLWTRLSMTRHFLQKDLTEWANIVQGQRQFDKSQWLDHNEQKIRHFEPIMAAQAPHLVARLGAIMQERITERLLDVGGGSGIVASLLACSQPNLIVTVLNWPDVCPLISKTAEKFNVSERVLPHPANFLSDNFPSHYDAALFAQVLVNWSDEVVSQLLNKTYQALNSERGQIIICEQMGSPPKDMSRIWLTFMAMRANVPIEERTPLRWVDLLDQAGFHNPRLQGDGTEEGYRMIQAFMSPEQNGAEQLRPSQTIYHNGDTVRITIPPSPEGYTQYVGIRIPAGGQTFVVNQFNRLQPFDGVNLSPWQGDEAVIEQVVLPNVPRGKYLLYLLHAPEGIEPLAANEPWTLNVSAFRIK
jgi:hypothetical protein